jgi:hypothetical protein
MEGLEMAGMIERDGVWTLDKSHSWDGAEIVVTASEGGASISVSEEQAVDSYNKTFTCTMQLTQEEAEKLALFIIRSVRA